MTSKERLILMAAVALASSSCRSRQQQPSPGVPPEGAAAGRPAAPPVPASAPLASSARPHASAHADAGNPSTSFNFDADRQGTAPAGFIFGRTGGGVAGRWIVRAETDAPSPPNVLAQMDADDTNNRYPIAVAQGISPRDLRVTARCKLISGRVDQACGLVFRYRDENNYYVTRANVLENNIRLYYVKDGKRRQIASYEGPVTANAWHEYAVEMRRDQIQVFWNRQKVLDHRDRTFAEAGRAGFWTKADSVTYFDDLAVTPLDNTGAP